MSSSHNLSFHLKVLGRTLEHLGVQMYKQRGPAIAELVANAWDANATKVEIRIPNDAEYGLDAEITIYDNGIGMGPSQIDNEYLVVGRNRRGSDGGQCNGRPVMGRKGIGKLAGFGIAKIMAMTTWRDGVGTEFSLDIDQLKTDDDKVANFEIQGKEVTIPPEMGEHGTIIRLKRLKSVTSLKSDRLHEFLARRFSRRIKGEMSIEINDEKLRDPSLDLAHRSPKKEMHTEVIGDDKQVKYYYAFSKGVIPSKELRGFTIYVRGKTAQAPPFFFDAEGTASGQHSTRYITGEIEADFLDKGDDDDSDVISTDRQEIDWISVQAKELKVWGEKLARRILRECADMMGQRVKDWILEEPDFKKRIEALETQSQKQISGFLKTLGRTNPDKNDASKLADSLIKVYEFRNFHNVIGDIEEVGEDPEKLHELLTKLTEWKVLESRAILEIINGRLGIIEKLQKMVISDKPETASKKEPDNLHDLLASYPWIINPEWQVLSEEKQLSSTMKKWLYEEIEDEDTRLRYDFLALTGEGKFVVVEIKRTSHAVELDELQRLEKYMDKLSKAKTEVSHMMLIYGGTLNVNPQTKESWRKREDASLMTWAQICDRSRSFYHHYKALLEGNVAHKDFVTKQEELAQTRKILKSDIVHRGSQERKGGIGPQDVELVSE